MAAPFKVVCSVCKVTFPAKEATPGKMPSCPKCGGALKLLGKPIMACDVCRTKVKTKGLVPLARPILCPKCRKPMRPLAPRESAKPGIEVTRGGSKKETPTVDSEAATIVSEGGAGGAAPPEAKEAAKAPEFEIASEEDKELARKEFGKYVLQSEIARGGMGIVYRAYDPELKRVVALKVLIAGEGADVVSIARFLREARSAGSLQHPNVVTIYEVGEVNGQHYFTMEYVDGKDLSQLSKMGMPLRDLVQYTCDVGRAVATIHGRGIIHRDLKPENIMVDKNNRVRVMDFGLAKDLTGQTMVSMSGAMLGTPSYMSPEQAKGSVSKIDHRTDVYSMGVILYELTTGQKPFEGKTVFDTIEAVMHQEALPPVVLSPDTDKDLNVIIQKCMQKDPAKRYQNMSELVDDLQRYLDDEPILARPVSASSRTLRKLKKSKAALVIGSSTAAAVVVAVLVYVLFAGGGTLDTLREEVASKDTERMASALVTLDSLFKEKKIRSGSDVEEALATARGVLGGGSEKAETLALEIIAREQDVQAVPLLVGMMTNPDLPASRRAPAVAALARFDAEAIKDTDAIVEALVSVARHSEESVSLRAAAAAALEPFWGKKTADALNRIARDTDAPTEVRLAAIDAIGGHVVFNSPQMRVLLDLQVDDDLKVVAAAEEALKRTRSPESMLSFYGFKDRTSSAWAAGVAKVHRLSGDHNRELEAVMNWDEEEKPDKKEEEGPKPVELMMVKLRDQDPDVRMGAAYDLGNLGDEAALPALVECLYDKDNGVRRSAARALLKVVPWAKNERLSLDDVRRLLEHEDALARENAAFLAGGLEIKEVVPDLVKALEKEQSQRTVRAMAQALADIGQPDGLPAIAQAFKRSKGGTAQACLEAMVAFQEDAVPHLIDALASPGASTRAAAVEALKEVTGEDYGQDADKWRDWLRRSGT